MSINEYVLLPARRGLHKSCIHPDQVHQRSIASATIASGKGALAGQFYETYNASGFATMYNHTPAGFRVVFGDLEIIPPDSATRGRSVPAGASCRRRPSGPTGYSQALPGYRTAH